MAGVKTTYVAAGVSCLNFAGICNGGGSCVQATDTHLTDVLGAQLLNWVVQYWCALYIQVFSCILCLIRYILYAIALALILGAFLLRWAYGKKVHTHTLAANHNCMS